MYNEETTAQMKEVASNAMDSAQEKISELNSMGSGSRVKTSEYLLGWQTWLGNISFSLAAIGGAVVVGKDAPHPAVLASLVIFLLTGLWIALFHKRQFEHAATNASKEVDEYRVLYDDKKKAAFKMWEVPNDATKHLAFLEQELKIMNFSSKLEKQQIKDLENGKVSYLNDIWLAMFLSAIYFLMWPTGLRVYKSFNFSPHGFNYLFWLLWLLLILIIIREAQKSKPDIESSNQSKILKTKSELKHTTEYSKEVNERIESVKAELQKIGVEV